MTIIAPDPVSPPLNNRGDRILNYSKHEPTVAEQTWAAIHLDELPMRVAQSKKKVRVWRTQDGREWRDCGSVRAKLGVGGEFVIFLARGAIHEDAVWLAGVVNGARAGRFERFGWTLDDDGYYRYTWSRRHGEPDDDRRKVKLCTDQGCARRTEYYPFHIRSSYDKGYTHRSATEFDTDHYSIGIIREHDETLWKVDVSCSGSLTPEQIASLASDLQWAGAEARKLNAPAMAMGLA